jgi:hypothetical protein
MEKELVIKVSYDLYETYYGANQICIMKDDDGYYVIDTNTGFSSQIYRLKNDALKKFRSHLNQYYKTIKSD